jgi:urease accessory protein
VTAAAELAALLLADGRFPAGGHVHSAGVEAAVADGRVTGVTSLTSFIIGRLWTVGLTDAALAAATTTRLSEAAGHAVGAGVDVALRELDAEADARIPVPALRAASRRQGRQLVRVAARCWPASVVDRVPDDLTAGLHLAVALGVTTVAAGLDAPGAARLVVHHALTTPAQAALRLLGLDPFAVAALTVRLADEAGAVVDAALAAARGPLADLPARTGPVLDIAGAEHARWDVRLFAT